MRKGHDFRDHICPDYIERHSDYLILGGNTAASLYLKDYANLHPGFLRLRIDRPERNMMLSIDIIPIPMDEAVREVENRLLGVETNITNWQRRQNANNNFPLSFPMTWSSSVRRARSF